MSKVWLALAGGCLATLAALYVSRSQTAPLSSPPPARFEALKSSRPPLRYEGLTAEEWARYLANGNRQEAMRACQALRILGAEGKPFIVQNLEHSNPEIRRICLESLSVSDLRAYGENGRQLLLRLAGDQSDIRTRELARHYLTQWNRAIPAPQ